MVLAQLDLRRVTLDDYPIARAIVLSLMIHALIFLTIEVGYQAGFWKATVLFAKDQSRIDAEKARLLAAQRQKELANQEPPLLFVEVDPSQSTQEAPPDAKYYSSLNSRAANPEPKSDSDVPKIEGRQEHVPQTMDRARPEPLQPAPPPPKPEPLQPQVEPQLQPQVAEKPPEPQVKPEPLEPAPPQEPVHQPGDLAYAKPREETQPKPAVAERPKPTPPPQRVRRLADLARPKSGMAGEKMKQKGGVKRFALEPSFDVRATPFGAYDAAIIAAIQKRWYDLLDAREFPGNLSGKVVIEFRLNSNGTVTDLRVSETDVNEILSLMCQEAVQDPAPFAKWPPDLRRLVGKDYREVRFTFYYN